MKKSILIKITVIFFGVLLLFTFISRSVYTARLPVVTAVNVTKGSITTSRKLTAEPSFLEEEKITAGGPWKIKEVFVRSNQSVLEGWELFSVDVTEYERQHRSLELNLLDLQSSLSMAKKQTGLSREEKERTIEKVTLQISMLEDQIRQLEAQYPADGIIRAGKDGIVDRIYIEDGDTVPEGTDCMFLHDPEDFMAVTFYLSKEDGNAFQTVDKISVTYATMVQEEQPDGSYKSVLKTETGLAMMSQREVTKDGTGWEYQATLQTVVGKPMMTQAPRINISINSEVYEYLVPSSCVKRGSRGAYVMIIKEKRSLFGKEYYVEEMDVEELQQGNGYTAIKASNTIPVMDIVATTTLPIYNGASVVVQ